jgi:hypothetical protein
MEIATKIPVAIEPINNPPSASAPNNKPTAIGNKIGRREGTIISLIAAWVSISTALE